MHWRGCADLLDSLPAEGGTAHVLLVGCDHYPHLANGGHAKQAPHVFQALDQLSTSEPSVERVARWLLTEHNHPGLRLATLAVLASSRNEPKPIEWTGPDGLEHQLTPDVATAENVTRWARHWFERADSSENNVLIFYFCGHGLVSGSRQALLLRNFGGTLGLFDGAIDLMSFSTQARMANKASRQLYLIDACRTPATRPSPADLTIQNVVQPGSSLLDALAACIRSPNVTLQAAILHATAVDRRAYGRVGKPSLFAEGLLRALRGPAARMRGGAYEIGTADLLGAIDELVALSARLETLPITQRSQATQLDDFTLHFPKTPLLLPIHISCDPVAANLHGRLCLASSVDPAVSQRDVPGSAFGWAFDLPAGHYELEVEFNNGAPYRGSKRTAPLAPIYGFVSIPVA